MNEPRVFEPFELRNTNGWILGGEFVASVGLGFFVPDLIFKPPEQPLTCAEAW